MAHLNLHFKMRTEPFKVKQPRKDALRLLQARQLHSFRDCEKCKPGLPDRPNRRSGHTQRVQAGEKQAASDPLGPGVVKELPIFPLNLIAYPTAEVPLNIFEARSVSNALQDTASSMPRLLSIGDEEGLHLQLS